MAKFAMLIAMVLAMGGGLFATFRDPEGDPSQVPAPTQEQLGTLHGMVLGFFDWIASLDGPAVKQIIAESAEQLDNNPPPGVFAPPPAEDPAPGVPAASDAAPSAASVAVPEGSPPPTDWYRR